MREAPSIGSPVRVVSEVAAMQDSEQLARAFFEAWGARDFDRLATLYAPGAEYYVRSDGYSSSA